MTFYNPMFHHDEKAYEIPERSLSQEIIDAHKDGFSAWLMESSMPIWVRVWLLILIVGILNPYAFLPHPFAISHLVGMLFIYVVNGREIIRVRGLNKNMGWPHIIGLVPTVVVGILSLTTESIGEDGKLTWDAAGDDSYKQARFVMVWYTIVVFVICLIFDIVDTILYYKYDKKNIDRSAWTTRQLIQNGESAPDQADNV
mmetsp:Transcript_14343/g.34752  ORF Transcript_14343/g.34752 Transcript_14343/m.34752 type:complete len:200 (+) Transcript_14343:425-1024(+)|eukprot:CAMPEP_0113639804 /NCGR_PEP_ID=MMETSP0017_2-20120614/20889_1 /TAXON_ID=2856 /ORGANISM="Cylindrotheca closterium" /LENGTH=199 /DNA_ID=CAMNT_0000551051 /DNA_START=98 /DNA_END=697 /DNA_ORIENTATION=+ /assembly_acc=CAM_ASM_000147